MKKHLVAFLSMIGLAGAGASAHAQVLKGSDEASKIKTESKIKADKQNAEKNATNVQIQDKRKDKWMKANAENNSVKTDMQHKNLKNDSSVKGAKNTAESKALKGQTNSKLKTQIKGQAPSK